MQRQEWDERRQQRETSAALTLCPLSCEFLTPSCPRALQNHPSRLQEGQYRCGHLQRQPPSQQRCHPPDSQGCPVGLGLFNPWRRRK